MTVLILRVGPFCCVLIEKKAASSMAPCSYHGHWHQGSIFQIYFSPFFVLLFAAPTTPEELSWDQSVMLETQTLEVQLHTSQDRTRLEQVFLTDQKELNFCFLAVNISWYSSHWRMGQSCLCPPPEQPCPTQPKPSPPAVIPLLEGKGGSGCLLWGFSCPCQASAFSSCLFCPCIKPLKGRGGFPQGLVNSFLEL